MNNTDLTIEEIQCLMWHGLDAEQIKLTTLDEFERLYDENQQQFDQWLEKAEAIFDSEINSGVSIIAFHDSCYPAMLAAIGHDAPPLIHLLGDKSLLLRRNSVAIIGARAADKDGLTAASMLGKKYAAEDRAVVSGLALGCDKAAHEGCLVAGGKTIAVVGSGLNITHPAENRPLQDSILQAGGLLLSEQCFGVKANPSRLVARNRLQAALSKAVILAQCPEKSGSMHTMRFARKYHRQCLAVAYPKYSEINGGNKLLIESKRAYPVKL